MNDGKHIVKLMVTKRRISKMLSTYYDKVYNNIYTDGCYRGYFLHCTTETGRLTSNLQQIPKGKISKVKRMFGSRYDNQ